MREAAGDLAERAVERFGLKPGEKTNLRVVKEGDLGEIRRRLLEARRRWRKPPRVDPTVYTGWSCAMARAELEASRLAGVGNREHALATLERVRREFWDGGGLVHGVRGGRRLESGVLEDYAYCILAALEAQPHRPDMLDWAVALGEVMVGRFLDSGGFRDVERPDPLLARPHYPVTDTPNYSGNALATMAAALLHYVTGVQKFREAAGAALRANMGKLARLGPAAAGLAIAVDIYLAEPPRTVVAGEAPELLAAALSAYRPFHVVLYVKDSWRYPDNAAMLAQRHAAYVCAWGGCSMPIRDVETLRKVVTQFRREAYVLEA